jgi:hypothetical protein
MMVRNDLGRTGLPAALTLALEERTIRVLEVTVRRAGLGLLIIACAGCSSFPRAVKYPVPPWFVPNFGVLDIGLTAPDFTLCDLSGQPWRLADHRGKVILLVFASNSDPAYIRALDEFNREVVRPYADNPDVLFVTVYSQESHPELIGGKWNATVMNPGSLEERRVAASQPEYRLRLRFEGKRRDLTGKRPAASHCVTLIDGFGDEGEPVVGKLYGYGRGGSTNPAFLIDPQGRLALKTIWLRQVLSVGGYAHGNAAAAIKRLLAEKRESTPAAPEH